jgi:hypothetical protein
MDAPHQLLARLLQGGPVRRGDLEREIEAVLRPEDLVSATDVVAALLELHAGEIVVCHGSTGDAILAPRIPGQAVLGSATLAHAR